MLFLSLLSNQTISDKLLGKKNAEETFLKSEWIVNFILKNWKKLQRF